MKQTTTEVLLVDRCCVKVTITDEGRVFVTGAVEVRASYAIMPNPSRIGDSREVVVRSINHGHTVEVNFEPVAGSYWFARGLVKPTFAAKLADDERTIEVFAIDSTGKLHEGLGSVPPLAALG